MQEREGITICATIHCPSAETFRLFDRVLLLQHGRVVYHGDNGAAVTSYFAESFPQVPPLVAMRRHTSAIPCQECSTAYAYAESLFALWLSQALFPNQADKRRSPQILQCAQSIRSYVCQFGIASNRVAVAAEE